MIRRLISRDAAQETGRMAKKGLETLKSLAEKAQEGSEKGLERLEEVVTSALKDKRLPLSPALQKTGVVPRFDPFVTSRITEIPAGQLQKRLAENLKVSGKLPSPAAEAEAVHILQAAEKQVQSAASAAMANLKGFSHNQGMAWPIGDVLKRIRVRYADGLISGGKARFLTPQGHSIPGALLKERYATPGALYQAIVEGKIIPEVLLDASAIGSPDMGKRLTSQLLTHEFTHVLYPAPHVGDALKEGLTELTAVTLSRKGAPGTLAGGYELEVTGAQVLVQLYKAGFSSTKETTEAILGHLLTSPRTGDILVSRLKLDYAEEQLLQKALQAGDGKTLLASLLQLHERLVRQKKATPLSLDAILKDLVEPEQIPVLKRQLGLR